MADYEGNVILPPAGITQKAQAGGEEILYSHSRLTQKGGTVTGSAFPAGALLKKGTAGTAKKYLWAAKADVANIVGVLRQGTDAATADKLGNIVYAGVIKGASLSYSDDTNGLSGAELIAVASALGGRYDATIDAVII